MLCASALAQIQLSLVTVLAFSSKRYISLKTDTPEAQAPLFGTTDFFLLDLLLRNKLYPKSHPHTISQSLK